MNDSHVFRKRLLGLGMLSALWIWLILGISVAPLSAQDVPAAVKAAAENGYRSLLEAIPPDALAHFNFSSTDEVEQAILGEGFRVYTIPPESILSYDGSASIQELIRPTSMWFFPVISKGQIRTLVTVDRIENRYKAVSIGGSGLSKQWTRAQERWPASEGYESVFVRVYQAAADFVVVSDSVETKMASLQVQEVKTLKAGGEPTLLTPAEIIVGLQDPVRANIEAARLMDQNR